MEGSFSCRACGGSWPLERGIPRFLPALALQEKKTAENFGYEWTTFTHWDPAYEKQFLDWVYPAGKGFFKGKTVLDAGCGKGRHSILSSAFSARTVIGVDLSQAVEVAYEKTKNLPNVHIVQGSIYSLPLKPKFDYIFSVGVIHHLPSPERGYRQLKELLKKRGALSMWIYGRENNGWIVWLINPLRKLVTSHMPHFMLRALSFCLTLWLYPILKLVYRRLGHKPVSKYLFYNHYLTYISHLTFREVFSIVFDHLVAPTAFYISKAEIESWIEPKEFKEVVLAWHNRNSWKCFLQK